MICCKWLRADNRCCEVISFRIVLDVLAMEGSYSVSTNNRFAFFMDEEDDPGDMVIQTESKSPKTTTEVSPVQKNTEKALPKGKDQKPIVQVKKVLGEPAGGKRREAQCELVFMCSRVCVCEHCKNRLN